MVFVFAWIYLVFFCLIMGVFDHNMWYVLGGLVTLALLVSWCKSVKEDAEDEGLRSMRRQEWEEYSTASKLRQRAQWEAGCAHLGLDPLTGNPYPTDPPATEATRCTTPQSSTGSAHRLRFFRD